MSLRLEGVFAQVDRGERQELIDVAEGLVRRGLTEAVREPHVRCG